MAKTSQFRSWLLASSGLFAAIMATPAYAQDAAPPAAQDAQGDGSAIVVTANRREERITDVGIAVQAFTGEQLSELRVTSTEDLQVIVPTFAAPGANADEVQALREMARMQVAFYGSTPNYGFIFEQVGHPGTTERIRERQKAGDLAGMAACIDDDLLEHFCVSGDWGDVADRLIARHRGIADRVVSYFAGMAWGRDPSVLGPWGELARAVRAA